MPRSTLLGINRLLTEERFREMALRHVRDEMVRRFWEIEFAAYPPAFRIEVVSPVLNKVGGLLGHPVVRAVVDSPKQGLSMRKLMDEGRVLVADLAKGRIGEDASAFLGAVLLARIQLDAYGRASSPPDARRIFSVHVDEVSSFATESLTGFLAEARKYGVGLVAATQQLDQLPTALRSAALGNVGSLVVFRVGPEDAEMLEPGLATGLSWPFHLLFGALATAWFLTSVYTAWVAFDWAGAYSTAGGYASRVLGLSDSSVPSWAQALEIAFTRGPLALVGYPLLVGWAFFTPEGLGIGQA